MKNYLYFLLFFICCNHLSAQLNVTYKSHIGFGENLNDVWGYVSPDGQEYALVGLREGVAIVDVSDAENPVLKGKAPGPSSTWRDIKTYGTYAYVTNETSGGLLVIDLSNLPNDITEADYYYWAPEINPLDSLASCHNIFVDEFGYGYLSGCNVNAGGAIYIDLFSNPGNPTVVNLGVPVYSHDIYVRDNISYSSEIYEGVFSIYDVSDKSNTVFLGTRSTPFNFTHNTWLSDDSQYLFTTDERANAPVASYDVSNFEDIEELDQFRPISSIGTGRVPHNVHVWNDWLIVSYYSEGCIIVDASKPDNLIEVGNFDTFIPGDSDMSNNAWGAYPFLPSGTILVSDIINGLFVLEPEYVRACWLEGKVTDALTGEAILDVKVDILTDEANQAKTGLDGSYSTGLATSGVYEVYFSHPYYENQTASATLDNGVLTILDIQMDTTATQVFNGKVTEARTGNPISDAKILMDSDDIDYETITDAEGNFSLPAVLEDDYQLFVGKWSYASKNIALTIANTTETQVIELEDAYSDDFVLDLGWEVNNQADLGHWERGVPIEVIANNGTQLTPSADIEDDLGPSCYLTGNTPGATPLDDVDNGFVLLQSPYMDLKGYKDPVLRFHYWLRNSGGFSEPDDTLKVSMVLGSQLKVLNIITSSTGEWREVEVHLLDSLPCIDNRVSIIFEASDGFDPDNADNSMEVAIDGFEVFDAASPVAGSDAKNDIALIPFPNPFINTFTLSYEFDAPPVNGRLYVYNILGMEIGNVPLESIRCELPVHLIQDNGLYILSVEADGMEPKVITVVRSE